MKELELLKVALRQRAVYLPDVTPVMEATSHVLALVAQLRQLGYTVSEPLLHALGGLDEDGRQIVLDAFNDVMHTKLNWASLVRGWLTPTGESRWDHFVTFMVNVARQNGDAEATKLPGITLPCGHFIPEGTFPIDRYTGCPFCGTPFETAAGEVFTGQGTDKLKMLTLWTDADMDRHLRNLLESPVPLNSTQVESLESLLTIWPLPADVKITMKETLVLTVIMLVEHDRAQEAGLLLTSPVDVMRCLWYGHTQQLQLIEPRTLLHTTTKNIRHRNLIQPDMDDVIEKEKEKLKLKYNRPTCRMVAGWLNGLTMPIDTQLEAMHPKREMWVRFIRALRLTEYARKPGHEQLRTLLDRFYRHDYKVWQGEVDKSRNDYNDQTALKLLQERPGAFARSLFSYMLLFGADKTLDAFRNIIDKVAPRLLVSLGSVADFYFDREAQRVVRPLTGLQRTIGPNQLTVHYNDEQLEKMKSQVRQLYLEAMHKRFANTPTTSKTIYLDPQLDNIPVAVGDRSSTIQDTSAALQGQRFPVSGDEVRLFMQWGKDMPASPIDMDLSCYILEDENAEACAYFNLTTKGANHSGDIRQIPNFVGTAEYVELSIPELQERGARRVVFTCNAYTRGGLTPMVVGWMSCSAPMKVSEQTGVAYDPSTVDHMVRISESNLSKGLIFGVLDVEKREIVWLEIPFDGQTVLSITPETIDAYLKRLAQKPTIGQLLRIKAEAQHLTQTEQSDGADEAYDMQWALDTAAVSGLLLS